MYLFLFIKKNVSGNVAKLRETPKLDFISMAPRVAL